LNSVCPLWNCVEIWFPSVAVLGGGAFKR
jgi:hypothetical protein